MENENICSLENKSCIPCSGGVPALSQQEIQKLQKEIGPTWKINPQGHLFKDFILNNFMEAMNLANQIASIAEKEGHHPDLTIAWGKCTVEIWTHKIQGLTESDFILAAKIDAIP